MAEPRLHEPRLVVRGLDVGYRPADAPPTLAVRGVSFEAAAGEVLAVVGESGAGKSSIGSALLDLVDPPGWWRAEAARLDGEPLDYARTHVRGRDVSVIFQDPQTALNPLFTVESQLVHMARWHLGLAPRAARARAVEMLAEVGIPEPERRVKQYPHQFSGGMRQRVVIALALACRPRLVIADEPTSALDVSVRAQILELIRGLCRERGMTAILITHDMGAVALAADRVVVMRYGEIVETGPTDRILDAPRHPYSRMLIGAVPPADRRLPRFPTPALVEGARAGSLDRWLRSEGAGREQSPRLAVERVTKTFALTPGLFGRGGRRMTAVDAVSFDVAPGEVFGLVGESGSGKSTLAQAVAGLHRPDEGRVRLDGRVFDRSASEGALRAYRGALQMVFQDPFSSLNRRLRVRDIVAEPIRLARSADRSEETRLVAALLERVGLPADALHRHPHAFSGGQRQRIAVARALAGRPRLLICDEPTSALDVSIQAQILNLLKDLRDDLGLSMLFITHDLPVVRQMCDRVGVMKAGRLVELSPAERLFERPEHSYTRALIALLPRRTAPSAEPVPA